MQVILNVDVKGLGKKLQVVEVNEGYARNYLLPKKIASILDNKTKNEAKGKIDAINHKKKVDLENSNKIKDTIEKRYITFKHKIGDNGKLFGTITEKDIATKIEETFGLKIDKKKIVLSNPIKNIGEYTANIKLQEGIVAKLKISVVKL